MILTLMIPLLNTLKFHWLTLTVSESVVFELDGTQEIKQAIAQNTEKKKAKKKNMDEFRVYSSKAKAEKVTDRTATLRQRNA